MIVFFHFITLLGPNSKIRHLVKFPAHTCSFGFESMKRFSKLNLKYFSACPSWVVEYSFPLHCPRPELHLHLKTFTKFYNETLYTVITFARIVC